MYIVSQSQVLICKGHPSLDIFSFVVLPWNKNNNVLFPIQERIYIPCKLRDPLALSL